MKEMARKPVEVTVKIKNDDPVDCELISTGIKINKGSSGNDDEIVFNNNQGGSYGDGFEISFKIQDETGKGYGFFQKPNNANPDDAISVKTNSQNGHCPSKGQKWDGFVPTEVSQDRQTLTVENPNDYKQYFGFAFYFSQHSDPNPTLIYDPGGDNQNGQPPTIES